MKYLSLLFLPILLLIISCFPPNKDVYSYKWAVFIRDHPGAKYNLSKSEQKEHIKLFNGLVDKGLQLYKMEVDQDNGKMITISYKDGHPQDYYIKALDHYSSAEVYFFLGNSLIRQYSSSRAIKAYEISLQMGYPNKGQLYYKLAQCYSQFESKDYERALEYLIKAKTNGYFNNKELLSDKLLIELRSQTKWYSYYKMLTGYDFVDSNVDNLLHNYDIATFWNLKLDEKVRFINKLNGDKTNILIDILSFKPFLSPPNNYIQLKSDNTIVLLANPNDDSPSIIANWSSSNKEIHITNAKTELADSNWIDFKAEAGAGQPPSLVITIESNKGELILLN